MYEKQWTLSTHKADWINNADVPHRPVLKISFKGSSSECREHLREKSLVRRMPSTVDVTFRLQKEQKSREDKWDLGINGILGVANSRGEYVVECEGKVRDVLEIVSVARRFAERLNDVGQYELWIEANDGLIERWVEVTLVVVSPEDNILRKQSLIPPGGDG